MDVGSDVVKMSKTSSQFVFYQFAFYMACGG